MPVGRLDGGAGDDIETPKRCFPTPTSPGRLSFLPSSKKKRKRGWWGGRLFAGVLIVAVAAQIERVVQEDEERVCAMKKKRKVSLGICRRVRVL